MVEYYGNLPGDPWQRAHDDFGRVIGEGTQEQIDAASEQFVSRCKELIARFKKEAPVSKQLSLADAFAMGDERRVEQAISVKEKACVDCMTKKGISLKKAEDGQVMVICKDCLAKRGLISAKRRA